MSTNFANAVQAWEEILGSRHVITDTQTLDAVATATFQVNQQVPAILKPANRQQVQECLKIANRHKTPVYPVSSGRNTGYGSSVPVQTGCAIIDLGRLNNIVDYNDQLGYVTIEPGVTQGQLCKFLQNEGGKFWMDATGASEHCSFIGNTMERGSGHSPMGDHFAHVCAFEVVLPNADCIHTGLGRFENASAKPVHRWGLGPYIDGLFTQSNLGIVTQMTVWLMPAPEYFQAYFFSIEHDRDLGAVIDALRPLRLDGTIKSALHVGNAYRVLSSIQQYPWQATQGRTPLDQDVLDELSKKWDFGAWNGTGALYGSRSEIAEARKKIKKALRGKVNKLRFIDDASLEFAERWQKPLKWLMRIDIPEMLKLLRPVHNMMKGIPTDQMLGSSYWRKKMPVPTPGQPEKDGCGLIWCSPIAPIDGKHARAMADIVTETLLGHGFEPGMTITLLTERSLENIISIVYDRDIEGEDDRALACYRDLLDKLVQNGYYPYRLGIHSLSHSLTDQDDNKSFLNSIKSAVDPNNILAPGRYIWP